MKKQNASSQHYETSSYRIKIIVVALLSIFTVIRLLMLLYFPSYGISDKVFFLTIMCVMFYLWNQELLDFKEIAQMHKELLRIHEELQEAEVATMAVLIKTEEAKDVYTRGHSEIVKKVSLAIAQEMKLDEETMKVIARAAILHDIGKIELSENLLNKKEPITDSERELFKKHPDNAIKILEPLKFLLKEKDVILQHHEHYDGKGYPKGLKGEEICLEAKIIAVADAFDAMNSKRAYRQALSINAITAELQKCRGTQFSSEVVDIFLALLEKNPQLWER